MVRFKNLFSEPNPDVVSLSDFSRRSPLSLSPWSASFGVTKLLEWPLKQRHLLQIRQISRRLTKRCKTLL